LKQFSDALLQQEIRFMERASAQCCYIPLLHQLDTKFEVCSYRRFRDIEGSQNVKVGHTI